MKKLLASDVIEADDKFLDQLAERLKMKMEESNKKDFYTVKDVANIIKKTAFTVRRHIDEGQLYATKVGRYYRIDPEQLDNYLNK